MRRQVAQPLLRHHQIWLERCDTVTHPLDPVLLGLEQGRKVLLPRQLHVRLVLSLLVLQRAVHQQDARIFNLPTHARRHHHILLEHHPVEHLRVLNVQTGNLLNLGVLLHVNLGRAVRQARHHTPHRLNRQPGNQIPKPLRELCPDTRRHDLHQLHVILHVDCLRQLLRQNRLGILQCLHIPADNDGRVQIALQEILRDPQHLAGQNNHRRRPVPDLLILGPRQVDDRLGSRMRDVNLTQNGVPVVRQDDRAVGVQKHLEHRPWPQRRPDNVRHRLASHDVPQLRLAARFPLRIRLDHMDRCLHDALRVVAPGGWSIDPLLGPVKEDRPRSRTIQAQPVTHVLKLDTRR
mmetsp:Transcript_8582/g.23263  ORF Transcript_8582/g.23263 Transcript_8582/m.23263 type:complete len:349 (+) Transcript_8582:822-1868(+)